MRFPFLLAAAAFPFALPLILTAQDSSVSGIDLGAMDTNVSACTNFYQYACGGWRVKNPLPPDQSRWGRFNELFERNQKVARGILEKAAVPAPGRSATDQKIGDYYASCMDEAAVEQKGITPVLPELDSIRDLTSKSQLPAEISRLQQRGAPVLFRFSSEPDPKHASIEIAGLSQGGLGLPDRDYYLKDDERSANLRRKYQQHVENTFELLAKAMNTSWDSKAKAQAVMDFETALAQWSLDRVKRRNPDNTYHPMTRSELVALTPDFDWNRYVAAAKAPDFQKVNVEWPDFVKALNALIDKTSLDDLKTYLTWQTVRGNAPALSKAFVDEDFDFYGKTLNGALEIQPRWKRCVQAVDQGLGEALGQKFVEVAFSGKSKERALQMVHEIEKAMRQDVETASWMTDDTKKQALAKLEAVSNKIGYPDKWRDYSTVVIKRDDFLGNRQRAVAFEVRRRLDKIGQPVDKSEWGMTPPTVNAYYNPPQNNINFPAGILQPPFYNAKADDAVNYGAIGVVVGHELTHGFDDQGRRYDGAGDLRDWWTPEDAKNFTSRADCIVKEYGSFSPVDGVKLKGDLTLGENAADNGGIHLAYMALMDSLAAKVLSSEEKDGFTPQQRFFLGFAQVWCENTTDANARLRAVTDPHSPGQFRVNGVVDNLKEFQAAFSCKAGDPMVSSDPCRVW